jgi:hypothetical protein
MLFGMKVVPLDTPGLSKELNRSFMIGSLRGSNVASFAIISQEGNETEARVVWGKDFDGKWLVLTPGSVHHIVLTLNKDHVGIVIDGRTFDVASTGILYDKFHIQLSALGSWHVRNFTVH